MMITGNVIMAIVFISGVILLQIFLSKKENKWAGLILPILNFLLSVLIALITHISYLTRASTYVNGTVVEVITDFEGAGIEQIFIILVLRNISTIILLMIYVSCRKNIRNSKALEKMTIKDLE